MNELKCASLGETWIKLVQLTFQTGVAVDHEYLELLGVLVAFPALVEGDVLIHHLGDRRMIAGMNDVFFGNGASPLGHSYANLMRGPDGRADLVDVISLLRAEPNSPKGARFLMRLPLSEPVELPEHDSQAALPAATATSAEATKGQLS